MFNKEIYADAMTEFKKCFSEEHWKQESYKWEAIKHFQDKWDIDDPDFAGMLKESLAKTYNLLASVNNYPAAVIISYAQEYPEDVRAMFIDLYDESKEVFERIDLFKQKANELKIRIDGEDSSTQSYQYENAISTYLWLKYPDKYYIYKYGEVSKVSKIFESDYIFKKGAYAANIRNSIAFYNELAESVKEDAELVEIFKKQLTDNCYSDPEYRTLTFDFGYYVSRNYKKNKDENQKEWFPKDYDPVFSTDQWLNLLNDKEIFTENSLQIMKRLKDYGGEATCTQLATRYGETKNFYNNGSSSLARRIAKKTDCQVMKKEAGNNRWWPILYIGRSAEGDEEGSYVWRLRDELSSALDRFDLSKVSLYANNNEEGDTGYWWVNANPKIWSFSSLPVGSSQSYSLFNENGNKRRIFQNFLDAKAGDLIIGYESNPIKQVVALGKISSEQDGEKIYFEKTEGLTNPIDYSVLKSYPELEKMEYLQNPQGSLFKLTKGEYDFILDLIRDENPISASETTIEKYSKEKFLDEVYMSEDRYEGLVEVLRNKKNVILQGAPGVGKTFTAKRLAYSIMKEKDDSRIEFVQFHQNYSYEDFVMGYKPSEDGFKLKHGIFYRFCKNAENHPDKDYFFIIDEINRGNLSKIFGELLMLIENDYRGTGVTLAYDGLSFSVPKNLYIIGMMNTADRSLALIDYALRRRFSFYEIEPGFGSEGFINYQKKLCNETFDELINKISELNEEIKKDRTLGKGFCIGHSYFCDKEECTDEWMKSVVEYDIIPMLSEYWFDDANKLNSWVNSLHNVFQQ